MYAFREKKAWCNVLTLRPFRGRGGVRLSGQYCFNNRALVLCHADRDYGRHCDRDRASIKCQVKLGLPGNHPGTSSPASQHALTVGDAVDQQPAIDAPPLTVVTIYAAGTKGCRPPEQPARTARLAWSSFWVTHRGRGRGEVVGPYEV